MLIMPACWALGRLIPSFLPVSLLVSSSTMSNINNINDRKMPVYGLWTGVIHHPFHCPATLSYVTEYQHYQLYDGERPIYRGRTVMLALPVSLLVATFCNNV